LQPTWTEARRIVAQKEHSDMDPKSNDGVQGEGNYDATHHYNEGVKKSVQKGDAAELAESSRGCAWGRHFRATRRSRSSRSFC
jgi:hypothetical protein